MQTSIEMLIDELTKNIVPTAEADETDLARNGAFHVAINYARAFQQREKDLILSAFDSKFNGTAQEFYNACFNTKGL
jgi:flagellar biosynthesis/type III secretory pathway ATPase